MSSTAATLADAVKAAIDAKTDWPQAVTTLRTYIPRARPEELTAARATIVPANLETEREARGRWLEQWAVEIAIQKRIEPGETPGERDQCDGVMELAETMVRHLRDIRWDSVRLNGVALEPLWDPEMLEAQEVFTAVIRLTFQ